MAMKVFELAKEMNVASKELIEKAAKKGIELKSHMSVLTDAQVKMLKEDGQSKPAQAGPIKGAPPFAAAAKPVAGAPPFARAATPVGTSSKIIGRPIVDESYFANKEKKKQGEEAEAKAAEDVKPVEAAPEKPVEKPAEPKAEEKPAEGKAEKPAEKPAEPKAEKPAEKPAEPKAEKPAEKPVEPKAEKPAEKPVEPKTEKPAESKAEKPQERTEKKPVQPAQQGQRSQQGGKGDRTSDRGRDDRRSGGRDDRRDCGERRDDRRSGGDGRRDDRRSGGRDDRRDGGRDRAQGGQGSGRPVKPSTPKRPGDSRDRAQGGQGSGSAGGQGRKDNRKGGKPFESKHDKFDKFERKSLEKQTKGKHAKYKNVEVEPEVEMEPIPEGTFVLNVPITVAGFCEQTEVSTSKVIMTLMKMGIMANINQNIDEATVMVLADELGINVMIGNVEDEVEEKGLELFEDDEKDLRPRPPIITVMGHVDHGKTSLLDAIRKTNVTASESGGITQHIGASQVSIKGQKIVFLDTPGHEAFTAMRARGAHVTDIAVLVVAADDGVMPQTVESISHAKAAGVPIIVAINKMDKPGANPDRVKQELTEHGILVEEWGGDVISVPVSAKTGEGITNLLEMILLQAEVLELKANPNRLAMGSVIEARLDKSKGPVATLLVLNGTLETGQSVVAGTCAGRIRLMTDDKGKTIKKAGPATAVEILGLTDVPQAGDEFNAVKEDRIAREIAESRKEKLREEVMARNSSMSLEKLFSQIQEGEVKELNLIIKGDVQGSIGALVSSLEKLNNNEVKVNIIHTGVGTVTESDVMLAGTSDAVIIGFNVRPSTAVQSMADRDNIEIRTYRVIYDVIDDVEAAMKGMLDPEFKEELLGKVEIRNTFKVPNVGVVGGAYVTEGKVVRNAEIRLVRDGIVIHEGKISSLKRFKDDAKEVNQGYECGIGIENYNDIKEGDIIECFHMVETERK